MRNSRSLAERENAVTVAPLFGPLDPSDLSRFEDRYGAVLPLEYREFLSKSNGGQPTPNTFDIPDCGASANVDLFYGIGPQGEPGDLGTEYEQVRDELPAGFLPIAHDPGGNYVLLCWIGSQAGEIYYWDANHFFEQSDESGDTYRVAKNINDFLAALH